MFPNISERQKVDNEVKTTKTMKFGQLIEYNKRNIFL